MACSYPNGCTNTVTTTTPDAIHNVADRVLATTGSDVAVIVLIALMLLILGGMCAYVWRHPHEH